LSVFRQVLGPCTRNNNMLNGDDMNLLLINE